MKSPIDTLKKIIGELAKVTDTERAAIGKRAFDQIISLTEQKESLLAQFNDAARALSAADLNDPLMAELDAIRIKAVENAAVLKATAQGVREARSRLKKIRDAEFNAGVYGEGGAALRHPGASTFVAKA